VLTSVHVTPEGSLSQVIAPSDRDCPLASVGQGPTPPSSAANEHLMNPGWPWSSRKSLPEPVPDGQGAPVWSRPDPGGTEKALFSIWHRAIGVGPPSPVNTHLMFPEGDANFWWLESRAWATAGRAVMAANVIAAAAIAVPTAGTVVIFMCREIPFLAPPGWRRR
jgi:hypothetical protein